jgi:hypothetical protein
MVGTQVHQTRWLSSRARSSRPWRHTGGEKDGRTGIFYLKLGTSHGRSVEGGTPTKDSTTMYAPEGFQLSGFHGRADDNIDALGAIFTRTDQQKQQA